jgi:hypothetical protein
VSTSTENAPVYRKNTRKLTIKLFASYLYLESGMSAILLVVPSNITNKFQKFLCPKLIVLNNLVKEDVSCA